MDPAGILSVIAIVISVASAVLGAINHTHIRSNCNGSKLDVSLDIDRTSPPSDKLKIKIPTDPKV